ncbi:MAG: ABC transporter ATP-binding protein [Bacteroidia bacterium]|nr:ABC transporter ATP-binding protein [Bacteroidia bacterium]MDW8302331.1 ABC transporter ATP-binding protein [Bacteroidia bacterium]
MNNSLAVEHLTKSYSGKIVLDDISIEFLKSKVNMVIGASGSGKSTLLKCLVGLTEPDSGKILYHGRNLIEMNYEEKKEIRQQIGMLFQGGALFDSLTVGENIAFPLRMFSKMSKKEIAERVAFCLERVNMPGVEKKYPSELSGGMRKRVGIARAIALNPQYLFCDEPNSGLDPLTSIVIDELIAEITEEYGITTIVNTHDMHSVLEIGDKIIFIHEGKKHWEGNKYELREVDEPIIKKFVFASKRG